MTCDFYLLKNIEKDKRKKKTQNFIENVLLNQKLEKISTEKTKKNKKNILRK